MPEEIKTIECHGKCKKPKLPTAFRLSDLKSTRPICRSCRKELEGRRDSHRPGEIKRPRGWGFRATANTLCPGSSAIATIPPLQPMKRGARP